MRASLLRASALFGLMVLAACAANSEDDAESDEAPIQTADLDLGEKLEPNETTLVKQIADAAAQQVVQNQQAAADRVARRDAHPKAHGCVSGSFSVYPNIPADLAVGTFKPGKHYDTWIRFSNGSNVDDTKDDARGMAIKLLNATEGPRLLANDASARTHDLVLTNHPSFFLSNLADYVGFMQTVTNKGNPLSFFISWNPFEWHIGAAIRAHEFTTEPITSPLTSQYWSATPYKLGNKAVKYSAIPCDGPDRSNAHPHDPNFLKSALKAGLASGTGACFEFMIQRQTNNDDMPIEDSTKRWDEDDSPFVRVARIQIPAQSFDSAEQQKFCENLSFTPWHATPDHRPLGSMNRTRKVVYEATSAARHRLNGVARVEPTDLTVH